VTRQDIERNKENAAAFYAMAFNENRPADAIERFVGDEYIQHNPHVGNGKQPFIDYFDRMAAEYPGKHVEFVRAIGEGNLVVLHCHQTWPGDHDYATIDIFRFDDDGKIVEHWDVLQVVPTESAHDNGMF
jgi:predicted SnoaL-like aldol condensation-catalyzing enzyme